MPPPKDPKKREQYLANLRGKNNSFYGQHHTEESLQKMRGPRPSMQGDGNPMKRPEVRAKITGDKNPMFGKHHTEESLQKMRKPHPSTQGDGNPMKRPEVRVKHKEAMNRPEVRAKHSLDMMGENNPAWVEDVVLICAVCGEEFPLKPWEAKTRKICSQTCAGKLQSKRQVGENNPSWHGGTGNFPYAFEFNEEFKTLIRERDDNTCQLCDRTQEEEHRKLSVHHIYYDRENSNMDPERFITLCNICNNKVNSDRENWTEFFESKLKGDTLC